MTKRKPRVDQDHDAHPPAAEPPRIARIWPELDGHTIADVLDDERRRRPLRSTRVAVVSVESTSPVVMSAAP